MCATVMGRCSTVIHPLEIYTSSHTQLSAFVFAVTAPVGMKIFLSIAIERRTTHSSTDWTDPYRAWRLRAGAFLPAIAEIANSIQLQWGETFKVRLLVARTFCWIATRDLNLSQFRVDHSLGSR